MDGRFLLMLRALGDYAGLMVFPGRLYMERADLRPVDYRSVAAWRTHPHSILVHPWFARWDRGLPSLPEALARQRLRCFGALWFVLAFLPISNLFPAQCRSGRALDLPRQHRPLFSCWPHRTRPSPRAQIAAAAVTFSGGDRARHAHRGTRARLGECGDFLLRTIADGGATRASSARSPRSMGERGDFAKQEAILRENDRAFPVSACADQSRLCLSKQGRGRKPRRSLRVEKADADAVAHRYPRTWPAALNLARLRQGASTMTKPGLLAEARTRFPETWELVKIRKRVRKRSSESRRALPAVTAFAGAHWWHLDSWVTLGRLQYSAGQPDAAITTLRAASRLDIYNAGPHRHRPHRSSSVAGRKPALPDKWRPCAVSRTSASHYRLCSAAL